MSTLGYEKFQLNMASFVSIPALASSGFCRRPRNSLGSSVDKRGKLCLKASRALRSPPVRMCSESPSNDLLRGPDLGDMSTVRGFALQDSPRYEFMDLQLETDSFTQGGAYAIRNEGGEVCYMGYSKNIAAKLQFHVRLMPDQCTSFQVYVPPVPAELISPEMLENVLEYWVQENGGVPKGNTVDREKWERGEKDEKKTKEAVRQRAEQDVDAPDLEDVPIRERSTARRVANRRTNNSYSSDAFADNFRSSSGTKRRRRPDDGWEAKDDEYVEVDVDPLDPFSASKRQDRRSWDYEAEDEDGEEDWVPIAALMGCAGLIWLLDIMQLRELCGYIRSPMMIAPMHPAFEIPFLSYYLHMVLFATFILFFWLIIIDVVAITTRFAVSHFVQLLTKPEKETSAALLSLAQGTTLHLLLDETCPITTHTPQEVPLKPKQVLPERITSPCGGCKEGIGLGDVIRRFPCGCINHARCADRECTLRGKVQCVRCGYVVFLTPGLIGAR